MRNTRNFPFCPSSGQNAPYRTINPFAILEDYDKLLFFIDFNIAFKGRDHGIRFAPSRVSRHNPKKTTRPSDTTMAMLKMRFPCLSIGYLLVVLVSLPLPAMAANVYKFRDAHGNVLFTNIVNERKKPSGDNFRQYSTLEKVTWFADTNVHKYGNWGNSEFAVSPSFSKNRDTFDQLIKHAAFAQNIDHGLLKAIIHTESGFNPRAHSKPGAQGLMQLMPATANMYGVIDAYNPNENITAGARHIKYLIDRYKSLELALAAYNAGEGNVKKYRGIPPFAETRDYVKRVMSRYRHLYGGSSTAVASLSPARM